MSDVVERAKKALEGIGGRPWRVTLNRHPNCDGSRWGWVEGVANHWTWSEEKRYSRAQAEFIAAARSLVPELVAEIERLRAVTDIIDPDSVYREQRNKAVATVERARELAGKWRYRGEFGWGAWQEGEGPDFEGWVLDRAATELLATLDEVVAQ